MLSNLAPRVHVTWRGKPQPVAPRRTDIAGFAGIAEAGPIHKPIRIERWEDFLSIFGRPIPHGFLAYAVEGFFANGGRCCWVVRAASKSVAASAGFARIENQHYAIFAKSPGSWGNQLRVSLIRGGSGRYTFICEFPSGPRDVVTGLDLRTLEVLGVEHRSLTQNQSALLKRLKATRAQLGLVDIAKIGPVNSNSSVTDRELRVALHRALKTEQRREAEWFDSEALEGEPKHTVKVLTVDQASNYISLNGGEDGLTDLLPEHLIGRETGGELLGLATLEEIDEINFVAIPDIMAPQIVREPRKPAEPECGLPRDQRRKGLPYTVDAKTKSPTPYRPLFSGEQMQSMQKALIAHCERLGDRFAILDTPLKFGAAFNPELWMRETAKPEQQNVPTFAPQKLPRSSFAALYFPAIAVADPLRVTGDPIRWIPPSGHMAGIYARGDLGVGVHKPPANEIVDNAASIMVKVDDATHGVLNSAGVNVLKMWPGRGIVVGGARTLSLDKPFCFINVRRLMIAIREWIEESTSWIVFEPYSERLWPIVERVVRNLLDELWTQGMLSGNNANEAYSVVCDETTNPPDQRERARVICLVGVRPVFPLEFIRIRITVGDGAVSVSEDLRGFNA